MQKRCPWCGLPIETSGKEAFQENKKRTPKGFCYLRCHACGKFCGQDARSKRVVLCILLGIVITLALSMLHPCLYLAAGIFAWIATHGPLVRMDADEDIVPDDDHEIYDAAMEQGARLKTAVVYPTTPDFDSQPPFSQSAPVRIFRKGRDGRCRFFFLYASEKNRELLAQKTFTVYTDAGDAVQLTLCN